MEIRIYRDKKQCTCGIIGMRNICIIKYMNYTYAVWYLCGRLTWRAIAGNMNHSRYENMIVDVRM